MMPWPYPAFISVEGQNKELQTYKENITVCTPGLTDVFHFDMVEGSADALQRDNQILIPESMAKRYFGNESAIGKRFDTDVNLFKEDGIYYVGGVFRDFPENSLPQPAPEPQPSELFSIFAYNHLSPLIFIQYNILEKFSIFSVISSNIAVRTLRR